MLCTGRSGSMTFANACGHIRNYTSGHETRASKVEKRLTYPDRHIEVDHRLTWFLGSLDRIYGDEAVYVHLTREADETARSWSTRQQRGGQMPGFLDVVLYRPRRERAASMDAARLMVQTVTDNIRLFLRDKTHTVEIPIEDPHDSFDTFWGLINAEGNRSQAHATLDKHYNTSYRPRGR